MQLNDIYLFLTCFVKEILLILIIENKNREILGTEFGGPGGGGGTNKYFFFQIFTLFSWYFEAQNLLKCKILQIKDIYI